MALHMLPTKEGLIHKICGDDPKAVEEAERILPKAVLAMKEVYNRTQKVYQEHKLLELP